MMIERHAVRGVLLIFLCATVIGLALTATKLNPFLPSAVSQAVNIFSRNGEIHKDAAAGAGPRGDELGKILARTANENKTVIITTVNEAWTKANGMIDLFMQSFRIGEGTRKLLDNLLIVALDAKAYSRCLKIHRHCYVLKTEGVDFSGEKQFMTEEYLKMMWRRLVLLADVLKRGYDFVFSDADIMWLRDPFPIFSPSVDIQMSSDKFNGKANDVLNMTNIANTGFKYVRSNNRTINFYIDWHLSRLLFPGKSEQNVMNELKFREDLRRKGIKFVFLNTNNFGGFCERSQFLDNMYTMHANCCKGLKAKLYDLREVLSNWLQYKSLPHNTTRKVQWKYPIACEDSWKSY